MEPTQLQLLVNVVTITGAASLAGYCYLLKKENRRLAANHRAESHCDAPKAEVLQAAITVEQDIRSFAAGRRNKWVKGLASSVPRR